MKFRVRNIAWLNGLRATFIPRPFVDENDSTMHAHRLLAPCDSMNAFESPDGECGLSKVRLLYTGGPMDHA